MVMGVPVALPSTVDFRSSKWLISRGVVSTNAEEIANVSDLIFDRGSGRIEYLIIKTGTTLGMGGRAVAIPYASFGWERGEKDRFILSMTSEQLKLYPEYTTEHWAAMKDTKVEHPSALRKAIEADAGAPMDPYAGGLTTAKKTRVEGEVTTVDRVRTSTFGEQVVIGVRTTDNLMRRITLGPSWFINSSASAPMRGDKVVVDAVELPRDPDQLLAGTHIQSGDRQLHLRSDDGQPAWALKTVDSSGTSYSSAAARYLLLSSLPGVRVDCRGAETGKVYDIIIDRNSGELAFMSIDPNQNFLGVGDTKRLIPWSVVTVSLEGPVRIDASKEMVLASPETPSDLTTLNSGSSAQRVYTAFNVPTPTFEARAPISPVVADALGAWSARGSVFANMDHSSEKTISGKVTDISELKFGNAVKPARSVTIRTGVDNASDEIVLLGPASYMDNQKVMFATGDTITVDVCRTSIDGQRYWLARSINAKGEKVMLIDGSGAPAWSPR